MKQIEWLKTKVRDHLYLTIFLVVVFFGCLTIAWLLHFFYFSLRSGFELEHRISIVSLWVAIVGFALAVIGAFLAILQFQAAQHKPDLYLWIKTKGQEELTLAGRGHDEFELILENQGKGVARHVRVTVDFLMPANYPSGYGLVRRVELYGSIYANLWRRLDHLGDHILTNFVGEDEYVCYDEDWDTLGVFQINWTPAEKLEPRYPIKYKLRCERMRQKEGTLVIRLP